MATRTRPATKVAADLANPWISSSHELATIVINKVGEGQVHVEKTLHDNPLLRALATLVMAGLFFFLMSRLWHSIRRVLFT